MEAGQCIVDGCLRKSRRNSMCNMHECRMRRNGHTDYTRNITPNKVRFWRKVKASGGCWEWQGTLTKKGYGTFSLNPERVPVLAHRFAFEYLVAEIPSDIALDHLCLNKACVNPEHLDPVTAAINTTRHYERQEPNKLCQRGHELPPIGTQPKRRRHCKECVNARARAKRKERTSNV